MSLNKEPQPLGILVLSPFFRPNTGGVETHLNDLCNYLRKRGHFIYVVTYQPLTTRAAGPFFEGTGDILVIRFPWFGHNLFHILERYPILQFLYLTPTLFIGTLFFLIFRHRRIKAIHAHGLTAALITNIMTKVFRSKHLVVSMHAVYGFDVRRKLASICRRILEPFDTIFCLAERSKKDLISAGVLQDKLKIYVQWVNQDLFRPRNKFECRRDLGITAEFIVLFVGRMIELKGVRVLLEMTKNFSPEVKFVFVGDGPLESYAAEVSKDFDNVVVVGRKSQEESAIYFGAADIVAVPSQYEEGFARVVLESLSSGRPVIVSNRGCLPEMIDNSVGFLVEADSDSFTCAIRTLIEKPKELEDKTSQCRDYALRRYSISNAEQIERSYY